MPYVFDSIVSVGIAEYITNTNLILLYIEWFQTTNIKTRVHTIYSN